MRTFIFLVTLATGCGGTFGREEQTAENQESKTDESRPQPMPRGERPAVVETGVSRPVGTATTESATPLPFVERCVSGSWDVELVDGTPEAGWYVALALDSHGRPHLTYQHGTNLRHTRRLDDEVWEFETADLGGVSAYTSIAVDRDDRVHAGVQIGNVGYASRDADGTWFMQELVPSSPDEFTGYANSIFVDADGGCHLSFYLNEVATGEALVAYARDGEDGLEVEIVAEAGDAADHSAVAVDVAGTVHLVFAAYVYDLGYQGLASVYHAQRDGATWTVEEIASARRWGKFEPTMVLDAAGEPHVAYAGQIAGPATTAPTVWYAHRGIADTWEVEILDSAGLERPALVVAADGAIHAIYYSDALGGVRYAQRSGGGDWVTEDITTDPSGIGTAIALDAEGQVHTAFYGEGAIQGVYYAIRCP